MQKRPPSDMSDYLDIFSRRKWWIILPALIIATSVSLVSIKLPKYYRSQTLILVDPQKVPDAYVKGTVNSDVTDRLQTISQEVLSRTRLQKIIDQFGLYKDQKARVTQEDIIEMMGKDIKVDILTDEAQSSRSKSNSAAFRISYTGKDP